MHLLEGIGTPADSFKRLDKSKLFFETLLYSGKEDEFLVSIWKRRNENKKSKSNFRLIPILVVQTNI